MKTNKKQSKIFTVQISEEGLSTITWALEVFSRLGLLQFNYALECIPEFNKLSWEKRHEIEDYLKQKLGNNNYGIFHPEVKNFEKAFSIKKELEKFVNLDKNDGIALCSLSFDGSLYQYDFLPVFLDNKGQKIEHKKEFSIPVTVQKEIKKLIEKKEFNKVWEVIGKNIDFQGIKGSCSRISEDFTRVIVEKPYRLSLERV